MVSAVGINRVYPPFPVASREVKTLLSQRGRPNPHEPDVPHPSPAREEPALLGRCVGCDHLGMRTIPSRFVPVSGPELECELCPLCHELLALGDKRLRARFLVMDPSGFG